MLEIKCKPIRVSTEDALHISLADMHPLPGALGRRPLTADFVVRVGEAESLANAILEVLGKVVVE